jgi:hypothetical protein
MANTDRKVTEATTTPIDASTGLLVAARRFLAENPTWARAGELPNIIRSLEPSVKENE